MIPYYQFTTLNIGPITIQVWGLMVSLGIAAALVVIYKRAKRFGLDTQLIFGMAFWLLFGALLGARVLYVVYNPTYIFASFWNFFRVWEGGMSIMGGFLGSLLAAYFVWRKRRFDFLAYADVMLFGLPLGLFIGRLGCGAIHDHIGKPTTLPWGIAWPDGTVRHENGLYLSLKGLVLFVIMLLAHRKPRWKGFTTVLFLILYGTVRFFLDFLRAVDLPGVSDVRYFGLTPAQYLSIVMVLFGGYLYWRLRLRKSVVATHSAQRSEERRVGKECR